MGRGSDPWILGILLLVSYAYFYEAGGWNQNSRFALVRAIVEHGSLRIDPYQDTTGDRALWRGHYYSDKPPGTSLLAVLPVAVARTASRLAGVDPESPRGIAWTSYVATVATSGLFTLIAALAVYWTCRRWGCSTGAAWFAATAYGIASPAWAYATLLMGHGVTAGCLMLAFAAAVASGEPDERAAGRLAWLVGLGCGWAVVTELQAGVPALFIGALALATARRAGRHRVGPFLARAALGGAIAAIVLLAYNNAVFRRPLHVGYASEEGFEQLRTGLFGVTYPQWARVRELLAGRFRGLLPIAPLFALTPIGLLLLARAPGRRRAAIVAAAVFLFYLLLNASYFYWEGGWAFGPRQMTPGLPFLALGLAPLWDRWNRIARSVLVAGWVWGAAITLVAVATTPQPPANYQDPVRELLWPAFRDGDLSLNNQAFDDLRADWGRLRGHPELHAAWNVGELIGLRGRASLLPLAVVWAAAWLLLLRPDSSGSASRTAAARTRS